jgi:predicted TIM-barrel fold metal-dependent hydrolase
MFTSRHAREREGHLPGTHARGCVLLTDAGLAAAQISSPVYTYRALVGGDAGARAAAVGGAGALVAEVIAAFGPARCMFASNLPVDKFIAGSDGVAVMAATVALLPATLSPAERAGILEGNARRFYRF